MKILNCTGSINAPCAFPFSFAVSVQTFVTHLTPFSLGFLLYVPVCSAPVAISKPVMTLYQCLFPASAFSHHAASSSDFFFLFYNGYHSWTEL